MHATPLLVALSVCLLMGFGTGCYAQSPAKPDSAAFAATPLVVRQAYNAAVTNSDHLYSGPEYVNYALQYPQRRGDQFFLSPDPQTGSVYYNEHLFEQVPLRYDILLDQVVVSQPATPLMLRLVNEKLPRFTIGGHHFVRLTSDSTARTVITTGYYEVLGEGKVQLLARRVKRERKELNDRTVVVEFFPDDRLFARKAGTYYAVSSKAGVLRLFADRATEVQAYLRQNKLKLRKAELEALLIRLVDYYNQLPPR